MRFIMATNTIVQHLTDKKTQYLQRCLQLYGAFYSIMQNFVKNSYYVEDHCHTFTR